VGTALTLVLVVTLPERLLVRDTNIQFDAVGTAIWSRVRAVDPARPGVLRLLLAVAVLAALGAVVAARLAPFARVALLVPLVVVFVLNAVFVWENRVRDSDLTVFANGHPHTWSWVDAAVPSGRRVTDLFVDSAPCLPVNTSAFRWTEFFNERIGPVDRIGPPVRPGEVPDGAAVSIGADGVVRSTGGMPLRPGYVVTPPGLAVEGRELVRGTLDHLRLWRVDGVLRVRGAGSNADAIATACGGTSA